MPQPRVICPFCVSRQVAVVQRTPPLVRFECHKCGRAWDQADGPALGAQPTEPGRDVPVADVPPRQVEAVAAVQRRELEPLPSATSARVAAPSVQWVLRRMSGQQLQCNVSETPGGAWCVILKLGAETMLSESYPDAVSAIRRTRTIHSELVQKGWMPLEAQVPPHARSRVHSR
jgi:hypothetical protein